MTRFSNFGYEVHIKTLASKCFVQILYETVKREIGQRLGYKRTLPFGGCPASIRFHSVLLKFSLECGSTWNPDFEIRLPMEPTAQYIIILPKA